MIRVVIDANVLVSVLVGAGPSSRIVAAVFTSEQLDAVVCPLLVAERPTRCIVGVWHAQTSTSTKISADG